MRWDVFISYASEDKMAIAEPLAHALTKKGFTVWYDEFELRIGDKLRRSIDHGLSNSRFGIVILSKSFFRKNWPQSELDGLVQREQDGQKVILPLWHDVGSREVKGYSLMLADRVAAKWSDGLNNVVADIIRVISPSSSVNEIIAHKADAYNQPSLEPVILDEVKASTHFHSDTQHTGDYSAVAGNVPSNGLLKWSFPTGRAVRSSPVMVDGVVYVGSDDGSVYAVNADTGKEIWSYATGGPVDSSPAIFDGVVYVGSNDGNLYAIKANNGAKLWSFQTSDWVQSSPVVSNGIVYVGSDDHRIYAINAATGLAQWSQPFTTNDVVRCSPAIYNNVVYVGSNDDNVYAIKAHDGAKLWSFPTGASVISSPTVGGGCVFLGNIYHFYTLGLNGALKWKIDHAVGDTQSHLSPPAYAYARGAVYVAWPGLEAIVNYYNVRAHSISTGARLWNFGRQGYYRPSLVSSPAVTNDMLYVGTTLRPSSSADQSGIYALNIATGTQVWYFATKGPVDSSPAVVDGIVYVGSNDGNLYAIGTQS